MEFAPLEYRGIYASADDLPDPNETDVLSVVCTVPGDLYINTKTGWDYLTVDTGYYNCDNSHEIKREICKCCGASLPLDRIEDNGSCRCEWCRTWNYVW